MIAYYFRFVSEERKPMGYIGFAIAENMKELFWEIDLYGDPYQVEIKKIYNDSFCVKYKEDDDEINYSNLELDLPDNDVKWKIPKWPDSCTLFALRTL